ncbi:hypothetical protein G7Y89_g11310 [Cudoniella acicularis]|uniref:DUF8212 domain-containing protein n=1 Tax=Cudoniella acicularis TaxID=354080 RepID=A0A8H4VYE1_9HELO|nr:hypothetical protein G7Y89_g11310 [Cudoniella acicularis]
MIRSLLAGASIAERMSWAANRHTTRVEDIAYCLLGVFDIHMPLLYGEGRRAFTRLQEEILKLTADQTLFAWDFPPQSEISLIEDAREMGFAKSFPNNQSPTGDIYVFGLLAASPSHFAQCVNIIPRDIDLPKSQLDVTNRGLRVTLPLIKEGRITYALLQCTRRGDILKVVGVPLLLLLDGRYARVNAKTQLVDSHLWQSRSIETVYITTKYISAWSHAESQLSNYTFILRNLPQDFYITGVNGFENATWHPVTNAIALPSMRYGEERRVLVSLATRGREFAVTVLLILRKHQDRIPFVTTLDWANYSLCPVDQESTTETTTYERLIKSVPFGDGLFFVSIEHERVLEKDVYFVDFKVARKQSTGIVENLRDRIWQLEPVSRDRIFLGSSVGFSAFIGVGLAFAYRYLFPSKR